MHFNLVKLLPEGGNPHGLDDVILPVRYALARLGYDVEARVNVINPDCVNILFGSCQVPGVLDNALPSNTIVFNLEQMATRSNWDNPTYIEHMRRFTVWDYSARNARHLREKWGLNNVSVVRLGYVPEMTRLSASFPQDVDVLFYGWLNDRRKHLLESLQAAGIRVNVFNGYGAARDHAIARAKMVLNVHFYTPATLEIARLGYLWANSKAVVSELGPETEVDPGLEGACRYAPYDDLFSTVRDVLGSKTLRRVQAEAGFTAFSTLKQEDFLEAVVGRRIHGNALPLRPNKLNAGSGKDFKRDCLNVDINPTMNPDLLLDLSVPLDWEARHFTARFGDVRMTPGSFSHITAFELLEHVRDLPVLMSNFLDLLAEGGELRLSVPYEMSLGAWQDPTHVRAFNENSWIYYCEWAWYMGWRDNRFEKDSIAYIMSDHGKTLAQGGMAIDELIRVPRAVKGMVVVLRKRASTPAEKDEFDQMTRSYYEGAVGEWTVT